MIHKRNRPRWGDKRTQTQRHQAGMRFRRGCCSRGRSSDCRGDTAQVRGRRHTTAVRVSVSGPEIRIHARAADPEVRPLASAADPEVRTQPTRQIRRSGPTPARRSGPSQRGGSGGPDPRQRGGSGGPDPRQRGGSGGPDPRQRGGSGGPDHASPAGPEVRTHASAAGWLPAVISRQAARRGDRLKETNNRAQSLASEETVDCQHCDIFTCVR